MGTRRKTLEARPSPDTAPSDPDTAIGAQAMVRAVAGYVGARLRYERAREDYRGDDWGHHGRHDEKELEEAEQELGACFERCVDARVKEALGAAGEDRASDRTAGAPVRAYSGEKDTMAKPASPSVVAATLRELVDGVTPLIDRAQARGVNVAIRVYLPHESDGTQRVLSYGSEPAEGAPAQDAVDPVDVVATEVDPEAFNQAAWAHPSLGLAAGVHLSDMQEGRQEKARTKARGILSAMQKAGLLAE